MQEYGLQIKSGSTDVTRVTSMLTWYVPLPHVQVQLQKQLTSLPPIQQEEATSRYNYHGIFTQ